MRFQVVGVALLVSGLAGCHSAPSQPAAAASPQAAATPVPLAASAPDVVSISPAQYTAAGIEMGGFTRQNMTTNVVANGVIDVPPQNQASVSAVLGGYVQTVQVLPGQHVRKGQAIAVLRHPDYLKLQQEYLQSQARVRFLTQELARQRTLDAEDVGARRKLEQAQADYATEQATVHSLAGQLRLLGLDPARLSPTRLTPSVTLVSPIGGFVKAVNIKPGQYVDPQVVLAEIVDRSDLHLELKVFEKDIARVHKGQHVLFKVPASAVAQEFGAQVFLVGKAFSDDARTVSVHAHLDADNDALLPGQYVAAQIQTASHQQTTLPDEAVIQGEGYSYIFARQPAGSGAGYRFRRYKVKAGPVQNGDRAIEPLDVLPDTAQLVRQGAYFLEAELTKGQQAD
ncbi:efflux RND transporter periplasmic adaptor subunit [Hymenobacter ginkgonis]|nr:efflux RND transporter periplasmic adaptor subunit [Hymenobacter ginkgonis]